MLSRNRLHSEILKVLNETCTGMSGHARSRLAVEIARGLHPVIVEQILREREPYLQNRPPGGYSSSAVRSLDDLGRPPSGPAPGAGVDHG